jgi:DNA-binding NarL/FixJ family response regulator
MVCPVAETTRPLAAADEAARRTQRSLQAAELAVGRPRSQAERAERKRTPLLGQRMPGMDGNEATRRIRALAAERGGDLPRVLVLTTFDLDAYAFAAIRAGASGFLLKDAGPRHLVEAIQAVYAGNAVVAPTTTRRLLDRFARQPAVPGRQAARLTA